MRAVNTRTCHPSRPPVATQFYKDVIALPGDLARMGEPRVHGSRAVTAAAAQL